MKNIFFTLIFVVLNCFLIPEHVFAKEGHGRNAESSMVFVTRTDGFGYRGHWRLEQQRYNARPYAHYHEGYFFSNRDYPLPNYSYPAQQVQNCPVLSGVSYPPIGALVASLPYGSSVLVLNGTTYYLSAGVYYVLIPQGYIVVPPLC